MEIHRRTTGATRSRNDPADAASPRGRVRPNNSGQPTIAKGAAVRSSTTSAAINPYNAPPSTMFDVFLIRSIQFIILLFVAWFMYLLLVGDEDNAPPSTTTPSGSIESSVSPLLRGDRGQAIESSIDFDSARMVVSRMREEFHVRYGGRDAAEGMLKRGLMAFDGGGTGEVNADHDNNKNSDVLDGRGGPIRYTADRFLRAIVRHESSPSSSSSMSSRPQFVMAFAGYSVTVGRGNHLEEAYPHVLGKILSPTLLSTMGIELIIRNSAIGGIPSFPYGWCLRNFLGEDADSVSWDYGMNEGNDANGLESYVRQSLLMPKTPPLFIILDVKSRQRLNLLQHYVDVGALPDPIALGGKDAVDRGLLELPESERPPGLRRWDEWGAPKGAPGQSPWHARKMEHELMAWMLAMRILDSMEVALDVMERDRNWRDPIIAQEQRRRGSEHIVLPPPVTDVSNTGMASLLHGYESGPDEWHMNRISCRTSFLPNISGDLNSVVEAGVTEDDNDMLQSRDDALFDGGWVMDVGKVERDTKLTVQKYGGLGYIDMKTALYGIPKSGTVKFWLPYESDDNKNAKTPDEDASASKYFNAVILCEVNEKRGDKECKMTSDLSIRLGGSLVTDGGVSQVEDVASYLKKNICVRVNIPADAKVSFKNGGTDVGLSLEVAVSGTGVSRENGACSISHVIWENKCDHSTLIHN